MNLSKLENEMVESLISWLERPEREGETVREVSEGIVSALLGYLASKVGDSPPIIHVGESFKDLITGKVYTPLWERDGLWWVVTSDSRYGYLGTIDRFQKYAAPTRAAPAKTANKDGWTVGSSAGFMRTRKTYKIEATSEKSALLVDSRGQPLVEPNEQMEKFYRKISSTASLF